MYSTFTQRTSYQSEGNASSQKRDVEHSYLDRAGCAVDFARHTAVVSARRDQQAPEIPRMQAAGLHKCTANALVAMQGCMRVQD